MQLKVGRVYYGKNTDILIAVIAQPAGMTFEAIIFRPYLAPEARSFYPDGTPIFSGSFDAQVTERVCPKGAEIARRLLALEEKRGRDIGIFSRSRREEEKKIQAASEAIREASS